MRVKIVFLALALVFGDFILPRADAQESEGRTPSVEIPRLWDPQARQDGLPPAPDRIRFVTSRDFPPFNFVDDEGRLTGFNVDIARAICMDLAIACTIQTRPYDDLVEALRDNEADAIVAGMSPRSPGADALVFSGPYLKLPARFVVRRGEETGEAAPAVLADEAVGVVYGSAHMAYLANLFPGVSLVPFADFDAAYEALADGALDRIFVDGMTAAFRLLADGEEGCCAFSGGPYFDDRFFGEGLRIAVREEDAVLASLIDAAFARLERNGVYGNLYLGYFPMSFY